MQTWSAADEWQHPAGDQADWVETWTFDASTGEWGVSLRCSLVPSVGRCVLWAALVHDEWGYVLVRDDDLALPAAGGAVEVRGSLWAAALCEEPLARWTLGLESFGVRFAAGEETEAWGREYGDVLALGLDLSFDDLVAGPDGGDDLVVDTGYARSGRVTGEVLVGEGSEVTSLALDAVGLRRHQWGVPRATSFSWAAESGAVRWDEHGETLPRDQDGMARTDGRLTATHQAPVRSFDPLPARVSRALGVGESGATGWLESWYPSDGR